MMLVLFPAVVVAFFLGWAIGSTVEARSRDELHRISIEQIESRAIGDVAREQEILHDTRVMHAREIERIVALHRDELTRLGNMAQTSRPDIPDATRIPAKPDAELRLLTMIREDTITRGAERLREEYKAAGLELSEEEARLQAAAMLNGESLSNVLA